MGKIPAFQFYPGDWLKDPALRRARHATKGVWIDLLCLMWECEERGVLATAGRPWSDEEIARAVGGDRAEVLQSIHELVAGGIAQRRTDGALYSRRMVRDEHKRKACQAAGRRGGNPALKGGVKGAGGPAQVVGNHPTLKGGVNPTLKQDGKGELTPSSSASAYYSHTHIPSLADVEAEAEASGLSVEVSRIWFDEQTGQGWVKLAGPATDWRGYLRSYCRKWTQNARPGPAMRPKASPRIGSAPASPRLDPPDPRTQAQRDRETALYRLREVSRSGLVLSKLALKLARLDLGVLGADVPKDLADWVREHPELTAPEAVNAA